jgi:phosphoglucosamine mutase
MQKVPQVLVSVPVARKEELDGAFELQEAVRASEKELGDSGRILVRASGTEQLVRVMVEAETEEAARHHADTLVEHVRAALA